MRTLHTALSRLAGYLTPARRRQLASEPYGPEPAPPSRTLDPARLSATRLARYRRRAELDRHWQAFTSQVEPQRAAETVLPPARPAAPAQLPANTTADMDRWRDWWAEWPPPGADLDELTSSLREWLLEHPELIEHIRREPTRLVRRDELEAGE